MENKNLTKLNSNNNIARRLSPLVREIDIGIDDDTNDKIPIYINGDHVLIFNLQDMKKLSIEYGIVGQLSGTLPLAPQQNSLLGFPWRLTIYETLWLYNKGIVKLVLLNENNKQLDKILNDENYQGEMINKLSNKLDKWRNEKQREIEEQMKRLNIIRPNKNKLHIKSLDNLKMKTNSSSMTDLQQVVEDNERKEKAIKDAKLEEREIEERSKRNKIVFMETPTYDEFIDNNNNNNNNTDEEQLIEQLIIKEIEDCTINRDQLINNYQMFKYLKSKGLMMLPGMRFGGIFVSYPGDPLRYHAHQIINSLDYYNDDINLKKLCNRGRLATGVRKVWVVGGIVKDKEDKDSTESMKCFSIEWAGF